MGSRCHGCGPRGPSRALCDAEALLCNTADMTVSCAVEDSIHRAEMPARTTSETAACAREETEAYVRAELPSESPDRTSKRVNDHDAVDGSRHQELQRLLVVNNEASSPTPPPPQ